MLGQGHEVNTELEKLGVGNEGRWKGHQTTGTVQ